MKWISSIILSSIALLLAWGLSSCASSGKDKKGAPKNVESQKEEKSGSKNLSEMKISYTNKSSKVQMVVDINSQDVNLVMSGSPHAPNPGPVIPPTAGQNPAHNDSSHKEKEGGKDPEKNENWDDVMDIAKGNDLSKGDMQQVLAEIRKAQEFFYQKRFPEALDMVKFSLQKQETSDGYALMGSILYMMDDKPGAKEAWLQSLRLNPDMPAVIQMLNKIKKSETHVE